MHYMQLVRLLKKGLEAYSRTRDGALYYTMEGEGRDYGAIVRRAWLGDRYGEPRLKEARRT